MKGLLRKDFLLLNAVVLPMVAMLIMFSVSGVVEYIDVVYTFPLWSMVILTAIFNQDRYYRMEEFISSIPDGKIKAIKSKYIMAIILIIVLVLVTLVTSGIYMLMHSGYSFDYVSVITMATVAFTLVGFSIFLPLTYRFGIMKTSLLEGIWAVAGMFYILFSAEKTILNLISEYSYSKVILGSTLLLFAVLCVLYVSYIISIKVYRNKER